VYQLIYHKIQVKSYQYQIFLKGKPFYSMWFFEFKYVLVLLWNVQKTNCWILTCDNQNVKLQKTNMKKISHVYNQFQHV